MMKLSTKKRKTVFLLICTLFLICVAISIPIGIRYTDFNTIRQGEFIFSLWDKYPKFRHYKIKDMEEKIDIWNLSRDEIVEMLGRNNLFEGETQISYIIKRRNCILTPKVIEYYHIVFADDGRVEDIYRWEGS